MEDQSVQAEEKPVEAAPAATEDTPGASVPPESDGSPTTETTTEQPPEPTPAEPQATPEPPAENVSCGDSTISVDAVEAQEASAEVTIVTDEVFEARVKAAANERFAKLQAKHDKMICDLVKERDATLKDLEAAKAVSTSLQADIEKLEADLAACRDQLTQSERNRESIVVDALAPAAELPTMEDGLAACKTLAERAAFLNAGNFKTH